MDLTKIAPQKKTYIVAALWALTTFIYALGWIDDRTYILVEGLLFPMGLATLRAGVTTDVRIVTKEVKALVK